MKKSVFTVVALLGLTAATTMIVTIKAKRNKKAKADNPDSHSTSQKHMPKGRHTAVRKRIHDVCKTQLN